MTKKSFVSPIVELNLGVFLISTSGVLGRAIYLPVSLTIFLRAVIALFVLLVYLKWRKIPMEITSKDRKRLFMAGAFLAAHWIMYFYSLQLSNVAIGLLTLYTFPVMTTLLEPLFMKSKLQLHHLLSGLLVLIGIYIIAPPISMADDNFLGVLLGLLSALCYAIRNLITKAYAQKYHQTSLMFWQLVIVSMVLVFSVGSLSGPISLDITLMILMLGVFTTAIGHTLFVKSLQYFSASTASLVSSMQPIYGIMLAIIFLREYPNTSTYIGGCIIVAAVFLAMNFKRGV
ncbi:MAG: DMT family transporter [Bacteroidota bacterium]